MLRPEVAAEFELTSRVTQLHYVPLGRDFDLTRISLAQAAQLVDAGCDRLRRKAPAIVEVSPNDAGPVAVTTGPAKGKKKRA